MSLFLWFEWCCAWLTFCLRLQHVPKCFRTCWYSPWCSPWYHPKTTPRSPQDHAKTAHWKRIDFFHQNVDLALMLTMGTFTENPCARMTIPWNKRLTNVAFASKCWFGVDNGDGHFYRESSCENDNPMKQGTHKCRFLIKMLIWRWRWQWALL